MMAVAQGIEAMPREEAAYWLGMAIRKVLASGLSNREDDR